MKLTRRTDSELELHESATLVWMFLGIFGVGGSWLLLSEGKVLVAAGLVVVTVVLALTVAIATTCRFDRTGGEVTCIRRSLIRTTQSRHPLAEIVGVRIERSSTQRSRASRIVLVTSTGSTIPLTTEFSSGTAQHEEAARAIRDFLGLPEPVDVPIPGFGELLRLVVDPNATHSVGSGYADVIAHQEAEVQRAPDNVEARRQLAAALALSQRSAEARVHLVHARDVASRNGDDTIVSQLDEAIRRLDLTIAMRR